MAIYPHLRGHVEVSEQKYEFEVGEPGKWFTAWSLGDGQAYAMIAADPSGELLATNISEAGYRFARAGFRAGCLGGVTWLSRQWAVWDVGSRFRFQYPTNVLYLASEGTGGSVEQKV